MQHVLGWIGPVKGVSLKPAREHPVRTLPLEVGADASCMGASPPDHGHAEGKARSIAAHTKHGRSSRAHLEKVRAINAEIKQITLALKREGLIP